MSRGGDISLQFGLEKERFRLGIGEWKQIQEALDVGPFEMHARLGIAVKAMAAGLDSYEGLALSATCKLGPSDAKLICYHGLIGGGMKQDDAGRLIYQVIGDFPNARIETAYAIVVASLAGAKDEPVGESAGAPAKKSASRRRPSRTASSGSPASTVAAPS